MPDLAAVLEALGASVVDLAGHDSPCPTCGIAPELAAIARKKQALNAALEACEAHLARCPTCRGWGQPYCPTMERLREAHFKAWQAYWGVPVGKWDPWRGEV